MWSCQCECGAIKKVRADHLRAGLITSCGCLRSELLVARNISRTAHGHAADWSRSPTYISWTAMLTRCRNPNADSFQRYGAIGIGVCERWLVFENFLADMGERPAGTSIDRRDNAKGYEPINCRWATAQDQENNKTNNLIVEAEGRRQTIMQWSREKGLYYHTLLKRIQAGWPVDRALNESA